MHDARGVLVMSDIIKIVNDQEVFFNESLTEKSIVWAKESQFAIQAFQSNDYLGEIALKNPASAQNAIINLAAIGITLNPASKMAYLVPRKGSVCLDISYIGLMHIAMSTGSIMWGQCKIVYSSDTYRSESIDKAPSHKYSPFGERGEVVGAYCTVKTADGDYLTDEMSVKEIKKIQSLSPSGKKGPWVDHWDEMARKTVVKRASKYWPKVDRLDEAIHYLNTEGDQGTESARKEKDVKATISDEQVQCILDACLDSSVSVEDFCKAASVTRIEEIQEARFGGAIGWIGRQKNANIS